MSDENVYDDEDLEELYEDMDENHMTPEEMFTMVTLNHFRKVKVNVELRDNNDDVISLPDTIQGILDFIKDKVKDEEGNQFVDQILPLMSQSVVSGLGRMLGIRSTAFMLSQEDTKMGILYMMCVAFLLLKFVQNNELKIHTYEEPVSDEEIEQLLHKSEVNRIATIGALAGLDPKAVLEQLVEEGKLSQDDINEMLNKKKVLS